MPPEVTEAPAAAPAAASAPAASAPVAAPAAAPASAPAASPAASPAPAPAASAPAPASEPAPPPPKWPDNWRELAVGELPENATDEQKAEHDKAMKLAKRYNSPADLLKAQREAQRKISAGELKAPLPKDATPEQVAEWRKENGIPETPDKYDLGLPQGVVLSDEDQGLVSAWVEKVHGVNALPDVVKAGAAALVELRDKQAAAIQEADVEHSKEVLDTLTAEWGSDYRKNIDGIESLLKSAPKEVADAIKNARGPGGKALINNVGVVTWLAAHARELGYVGGTVVPQGGDLGKSVEDEIAALEKRMAEPEWHKDLKGKARYMQLIDARNRMAARK